MSGTYQLCDLGQVINLSGPHFPQLYKVDDNSTYLMGLLWGLNEIIQEKSFRPELLKLGCASKLLRELVNMYLWFIGLGWGLRSCIYNKLPMMPILLVHGPSLSSKDFRSVSRHGRLLLKLDWEIAKVLLPLPSMNGNYSCLLVEVSVSDASTDKCSMEVDEQVLESGGLGWYPSSAP